MLQPIDTRLENTSKINLPTVYIERNNVIEHKNILQLDRGLIDSNYKKKKNYKEDIIKKF